MSTSLQAPPLSLAGRTLYWKFHEGPTADTEYEHKFKPDGTVVYRSIGANDRRTSTAPQPPSPTRYASFEVIPGCHFASYRSAESGYTLTVLVNLNDGVVHGFASNETEWFPLTGILLPED
ncbi:MAG TPA: hypothetical protein VFU23_07325 [Gemmatimonadales bacterium]|nr:hypothetical protein [Gemmatimonadales bacterium]